MAIHHHCTVPANKPLTTMKHIMSARWYVLLVQPKSEKKVGQRLNELGIEACVPVQRQLRQWSDRRKWVEAVLFPHYVFVRTEESRMGGVFQANHVYRYLRFGGRPAVLTPSEVEWIQHLAGNPSPVTVHCEGLRLGQEVEVLTGPMAGMRGNVVSRQGGTKLQVAFPSLGCFAEVEIGGEQVRAVVVAAVAGC
ncbi:MAG: hypothetical protein RLY31_1901 [Bacteroidota bacterium]